MSEHEYPGTEPCECFGYKKNIHYLDDAMSFCFNHGWAFDGYEYIKFCPWCGEKLRERLTEQTEER